MQRGVLAGAVWGCSFPGALPSRERRKGLEFLRLSGAVNEGFSGQREAGEPCSFRAASEGFWSRYESPTGTERGLETVAEG